MHMENKEEKEQTFEEPGLIWVISVQTQNNVVFSRSRYRETGGHVNQSSDDNCQRVKNEGILVYLIGKSSMSFYMKLRHV